MQCANCGFDNPANMKFCGGCGTLLEQRCQNCGFENPPNFKFCGNCGIALGNSAEALEDTVIIHSSPSLATTVASPPTPSSDAERRQLTVMFCDLVGSTALSHRLDPEELHQVVSSYQAVCVAVIERFEGQVAQYLGDGLLVYFGYPLAHEDDAQRAVRTGLGIIEAIERLSLRLQQDRGIRLNIRLGVHTGLVVVGQVGSGNKHEQLALGETPNIAARLQSVAEPNTLVISSTTRHLIEGFFATEDLGLHTLSGVAKPLAVYRVLNEYGIRTRLEAAAAAGLTPLVGREQELALLLARWEQVKESNGQIVCLNGEGGIGKSRLIYGLKEQLTTAEHLWLETHCSPYHKTSTLYPLITLLQQILNFERTDTAEQKLGKIEATLARRDPYSSRDRLLSQSVPLLANLLSVPLGSDYSPLNLSPQRQKQLTLEILLSILLERTAQQPVIFMMEDLHWVDPSTLEFINLLVEQGSTTRLFVLLTFRPTFRPTWTIRSHLTQLTLSRLTQHQVEALVNQVVGERTIPASLLQQVIAKTDGVPLFVEELTKMVLELNLVETNATQTDHFGASSTLAIPTTLQDSLMARLDRLATVKEVAQLAATLGREFSYELLKAVSDLDETTLQKDLTKLVEAEMLYQRGLPPHAVYIFKHALVQEAAYRSLLRSRRQQYHLKIGQVLARLFPDIATQQPELLAHHYTVAGLKEEAIRYWQQAGERAINHSANLEAIDHLNRALELLDTLPETSDRLKKKLSLQIMLGVPYLMIRGYASLEVENVYAKAWQVSQKIGRTPQLAPALFGLWLFYLVRADYKMAADLGDQLMVVAQWSRNAAFLTEAHQAQGITHFYKGELTEAQDHLKQALDLYNPQQRNDQTAFSGANPGVACLAHHALTLWLLGYPDQAEQKIEEAIALADTFKHPYSQVFALSFAAWLHQYRREGKQAQARAEAAIAQATEQGFELLQSFGRIFLGWALVEQGDAKTGITQISQGLETYLATGAELGRLHFMALLAEAHGKIGEPETGLSLLNEALLVAQEKGERFYEAELYRLTGELLLQRGDVDETKAESYFHQAITVADKQAAKSLALRAATNLGRLWASQGKAQQAKDLLTAHYAGFVEGLDTSDLQHSQTLLAELT